MARTRQGVMRQQEPGSSAMSGYDDGMNGIRVDQQIQQLIVQERQGEPAGMPPPPLWQVPALLALIAVVTYAGIWLFGEKRPKRRR